MNFEPIKKISIVEQTIDRIYNLIKKDNLQVNDRLPSERELSQQLGISRNSLREALRVLEMMGVIKVTHGSGMVIDASRVSEALTRPLSFALLINRRKLNELFEARMVVESECAGLAAERATLDEINALKAAYDRLLQYRFDRKKGIHCELLIHDLIAKASHNEILQEILKSLRHILKESREITVPSSGVSTETVELQARIIDAIARHDTQNARLLMHEHIRSVANRVRIGADLLAVENSQKLLAEGANNERKL
jgi:GntR family transcriptional repressor for pyruvate dehydrogenase complex